MIYAFAYAARERPKIIRSAAMALITFFRGVPPLGNTPNVLFDFLSLYIRQRSNTRNDR